VSNIVRLENVNLAFTTSLNWLYTLSLYAGLTEWVLVYHTVDNEWIHSFRKIDLSPNEYPRRVLDIQHTQ